MLLRSQFVYIQAAEYQENNARHKDCRTKKSSSRRIAVFCFQSRAVSGAADLSREWNSIFHLPLKRRKKVELSEK